jgi:hypothetical protein
MPKKSIELRAIHRAIAYYQSKDFEVEDVSRSKNSEHRGFDLRASKKREIFKIEVKGCSREWQIPDIYETERGQDGKLVADVLCVVYFIENQKPKICLIPRHAIEPSDLTKKIGYRISSRVKKQNVLEQYVVLS